MFVRKYLREIKIRNKRRTDEDRQMFSNQFTAGLNARSGVERAVKNCKGKSDTMSNIGGKVILPAFLFHFLIWPGTYTAGGKVGRLVCDYCFLLPR